MFREPRLWPRPLRAAGVGARSPGRTRWSRGNLFGPHPPPGRPPVGLGFVLHGRPTGELGRGRRRGLASSGMAAGASPPLGSFFPGGCVFGEGPPDDRGARGGWVRFSQRRWAREVGLARPRTGPGLGSFRPRTNAPSPARYRAHLPDPSGRRSPRSVVRKGA